METKYKIIISIFVILALLYVLQFIVSFIATEKKKDETKEQFEERFEGGDVYMDILKATEDYFSTNKDISMDVKAQALEDLSSDSKIKELEGKSSEEIKKKVKQYVDTLVKKEKYTEMKSKYNNADAEKEEKETFEEHDVSSVITRLDKLITEMSSVKDSLNDLKKKEKELPKKTPPPSDAVNAEDEDKVEKKQVAKPIAVSGSNVKDANVKETFVNFDSISGFENMRTFASFLN